MFSRVESIPKISKFPQGHDEHLDETLHRSLQRVVLIVIFITRPSVSGEYDVVSLGESHDEHAVDHPESYKILCEHSGMECERTFIK